MKIYIVTSGCYSDYTIEKVFTDRAKAEEYKAWLRDSNDIEEYETEDDLIVNKCYEMHIDFTFFPDGQRGPNVRIQKTTTPYRDYVAVDRAYGSSDGIRVFLKRTVNAENWNEDFYTEKYTKALYDYAAMAEQKLVEGCTIQDIQELFTSEVF